MGWIKEIVHELQKKYKTNDPFELAESMNVHVVMWDLHEDINGFYKYDRRNKYIFLNSNLSSVMQRFVCCHELGHAVLHPRSNTPFLRKNTLFSIDKIEVEANTFAVEMLIPDEVLEGKSIYDLAKLHGVPSEVAHLKK
ncbi:ImmA/IrrE family metallo-endopeptidase [Ornithinibacillus sp. JPR2-1]|uniref:ImmA/IrrE family metallo-endopeptidase n=1 Tax=Ornithinibacillus sp. JPR2-1 TaxID=2094019 RepID=UPI0031DC3145